MLYLLFWPLRRRWEKPYALLTCASFVGFNARFLWTLDGHNLAARPPTCLLGPRGERWNKNTWLRSKKGIEVEKKTSYHTWDGQLLLPILPFSSLVRTCDGISRSMNLWRVCPKLNSPIPQRRTKSSRVLGMRYPLWSHLKDNGWPCRNDVLLKLYVPPKTWLVFGTIAADAVDVKCFPTPKGTEFQRPWTCNNVLISVESIRMYSIGIFRNTWWTEGEQVSPSCWYETFLFSARQAWGSTLLFEKLTWVAISSVDIDCQKNLDIEEVASGHQKVKSNRGEISIVGEAQWKRNCWQKRLIRSWRHPPLGEA